MYFLRLNEEYGGETARATNQLHVGSHLCNLTDLDHHQVIYLWESLPVVSHFEVCFGECGGRESVFLSERQSDGGKKAVGIPTKPTLKLRRSPVIFRPLTHRLPLFHHGRGFSNSASQEGVKSSNIKDQEGDPRNPNCSPMCVTSAHFTTPELTSKVHPPAQQITNHILSSPSFQQSQGVSCYLSIGGEVDTSSLVLSILRAGKKLYVPKLDSGSLHMVRLYGEEDYR